MKNNCNGWGLTQTRKNSMSIGNDIVANRTQELISEFSGQGNLCLIFVNIHCSNVSSLFQHPTFSLKYTYNESTLVCNTFK